MSGTLATRSSEWIRSHTRHKKLDDGAEVLSARLEARRTAPAYAARPPDRPRRVQTPRLASRLSPLPLPLYQTVEREKRLQLRRLREHRDEIARYSAVLEQMQNSVDVVHASATGAITAA